MDRDAEAEWRPAMAWGKITTSKAAILYSNTGVCVWPLRSSDR